MWEYLCVFEMCVCVSEHVCVFVACNAMQHFSWVRLQRALHQHTARPACNQLRAECISARTHTHSICNLQCSRTVYTSHTHTHQTESPGRKAMKSYYFYTHKTHAVLSADSCFFSFSPLYGLKHFANTNAHSQECVYT